jgi:hypothetical protein
MFKPFLVYQVLSAKFQSCLPIASLHFSSQERFFQQRTAPASLKKSIQIQLLQNLWNEKQNAIFM